MGGYAIVAEILAIDAVITGEWKWWSEIFVTLFVVGGMAGVVFALVRPWYNELKGRGDSGEHRARHLKVTALAAILAIAAWGGFEMLSNVDRAGESQELEATVAAVSEKTTETAAVRNRTLALSIALARARRQLAIASARDASEAVLRAFKVEFKTLGMDLSGERDIEDALRKNLKKLRHLEHSLVQE